MVPYVMAGVFTSPADAFFESVSAFTTTGTSVLADGGASLPASLLLWHSLMGWLGGLNFILMLVSVMPLVSGCFGLTLSVHQSVSFSPMVASMQDAARKVGCIYLAITTFSVILYWLAGLSPEAAVNQGLVTLSTSGGDSLFDFLRYDSRALEGAGALSMLLASGNFLLYWKSWERRSLKIFLHDAELRYFLMMFVGVSAVVSFHLCTTASMTAGIICATAFSRSYPLSVPAALRRRPWRTGRNLISMSCFYCLYRRLYRVVHRGAQGHALYGAV